MFHDQSDFNSLQSPLVIAETNTYKVEYSTMFNVGEMEYFHQSKPSNRWCILHFHSLFVPQYTSNTSMLQRFYNLLHEEQSIEIHHLFRGLSLVSMTKFSIIIWFAKCISVYKCKDSTIFCRWNWTLKRGCHAIVQHVVIIDLIFMH